MNIKHKNKSYTLGNQQYDVYQCLLNAKRPLTNMEIGRRAGCVWATARTSELLSMGINIVKGRKSVMRRGKLTPVNTYIIEV